MHGLLSLVENISGFAVLMIYLYLTVVVIFIIMENRDTSSTLAWILIFLLFPIIGFIIYIFFGRNWKVINPKKKNRIKELQEKTEIILKKLRGQQNAHFQEIKDKGFSHNIERVLSISQNNFDALLTLDNKLSIFQSGKEKFESLKKDIETAKKYIHMEYYIWRVDPLTQEIKTLLIQKAKEGVEVRILYDPIGSCITNLFHKKYLNEMRKAGIAIVPFYNALSPFKITTINYILHRKIVIIDGNVGYTGGMNMGQEYITGGKNYSAWRDTHMRLEGSAALTLQITFAINWEEAQNISLFDEKYFYRAQQEISGNIPVQIISSEPNSYWQPIRQSLFAIIMSAEKNLFIQTPYFIPDELLLDALKITALSGVDVRIMLTGTDNKKIPYWAAFTYFEELLLAGVKIYHYNAGFLHAKTVMIDSNICSVGTTNMDMRSLHLAYESNVIIFDRDITRRLENDFFADLDHCSRFTFGDHSRISLIIKFRNSLMRLLSPLL